MEVPIYMVKVNGPTDKKSVDQLMKEKIIQLVKEDQIPFLEDLRERLLKLVLIHVKN